MNRIRCTKDNCRCFHTAWRRKTVTVLCDIDIERSWISRNSSDDKKGEHTIK